ncbi:unnamed protein product [Mytilus coruscus]|uniref:WSC domain-containing protein n=1 Tax=Mytilus coruscus TaxID=42192 RepID=A0A6J8BJ15_MYTCO|nr:unnamed protein product [Mytilus coruscus]
MILNITGNLCLDNNASFTTVDRKNVGRDTSCAIVNDGPWWYRGSCALSDLNGEYVIGGRGLPLGQSLFWNDWKGPSYSLRRLPSVGCFKDIENTMLPSKTVKSIQDLTLKKCQQQCRGYTFLGLQYSNECFCGNTLNTDRYKSIPESDYNMKCSGENRMCGMCGSTHRNSVYRGVYGDNGTLKGEDSNRESGKEAEVRGKGTVAESE